MKNYMEWLVNDVEVANYPIKATLNGVDNFEWCKQYDSKLSIEKVIFNNPATIIYWNDGTKTVVKCQPGDTYDDEKGFMAAYLKKLLGNDNTFNKEIKKYCGEDK